MKAKLIEEDVAAKAAGGVRMRRHGGNFRAIGELDNELGKLDAVPEEVGWPFQDGRSLVILGRPG